MRLFSALLISALLISAASAELLTTANPLGQGKWAVMGAGLSDSNLQNSSALSAMTLGAYGCYGLTDKLDIFASFGQMNVNGLPAGGSSSTQAIGLNAKYALIEEGASMPVSVAAGVGYKMLTTKFTGLADASGNQLLAAVGVSKVIVPFVPYAGLAYKKNSSGGADTSTQLDLSLGSAIAWSMQGAVYAEYTLSSVTPTGGSSYNGTQLALGVGYVL